MEKEKKNGEGEGGKCVKEENIGPRRSRKTEKEKEENFC